MASPLPVSVRMYHCPNKEERSHTERYALSIISGPRARYHRPRMRLRQSIRKKTRISSIMAIVNWYNGNIMLTNTGQRSRRYYIDNSLSDSAHLDRARFGFQCTSKRYIDMDLALANTNSNMHESHWPGNMYT
jgi:hypothetical protein